MNYCKNCGFELFTDTKFCPNCGKKLEIDLSIYKPDEEKINFYKPYNPSVYMPSIIFGIIFFIVVLFLLIVGFVSLFFDSLILSIIGTLICLIIEKKLLYCIFRSKKAGINSIFQKQAEKIQIGMDINEVRAIMAFIEPIEEGLNKYGEYCIYYSTKKGLRRKTKKKQDFEAIFLKFDSEAKLINCDESYRRTS